MCLVLKFLHLNKDSCIVSYYHWLIHRFQRTFLFKNGRTFSYIILITFIQFKSSNCRLSEPWEMENPKTKLDLIVLIDSFEDNDRK